MMDTFSLRVAVALIGGAAIGLERQWSGHATGPRARFGGIRTFTMLGGMAGIAGWLSTVGLLPLAVVLLASAAGLIVAAYVAGSRIDVDGTTEVAALVVLGTGCVAGAGFVVPASAVTAAVTLLLVEKTRLHRLVERIDDQALLASALFAAMALVALPLLPRGPYGPLGAIRPRELWALVLLFSGLSFLGWIARRIAGPQQGTVLSGLLGGLVSSTSVALTFARESRAGDAPRVALAVGVIGACTVMLVRVSVACLILNPALAARLPWLVAAPFVIGAAIVVGMWRKHEPATPPHQENGSPLRLGAALQMTVLFQGVLFVILAVQVWWSAQALVLTSAFIGLTDLDALTLSLARSTGASTPVDAAAMALAAGVLSNTLLKMVVALVVGRGRFRVAVAAGLGAMAAATAAAMALR